MTSLKENIAQMVQAINQQDFHTAEQTFNQIMTGKVNAAIENIKVDSADDMFNYQGAIAEGDKVHIVKKDNGNYHIENQEDLKEAVSRKDFVLAANNIKQIEDPVKRQEAANSHAAVYAKSNPRFDHVRFHAACGTKHGE